MAKSCNFQAVSAEENRKQYVRDALIQGINSPHIRQRLMENTGVLTLDQAFTQARQLEQAQSQSATYESSMVAAAGASMDQLNVSEEQTLAAFYSRQQQHQQQPPPPPPQQQQQQPRNNKNNSSHKSKELCWNCGKARHPRNQCPAREVFCGNCGKKGHFKEVCNSGRTLPLGAIGPRYSDNEGNRPSLA